MRLPITDFHTHVFPDGWRRVLPEKSAERLDHLRGRLRDWMRPYSSSLHHLQIALRHLPPPARKALDSIGALAPIPALLIESTAPDLFDAMKESGVERAVVIAHPPTISNEFVLELCSSDSRLVAAVNIPPGTARPGHQLKKWARRGAKLLKIHPASDGEGADSPRYRALLAAADELGMPVILHTGHLHSTLLYKDPAKSSAQSFAPWFREHPQIKFVLAHMNFHEPNVALDLAEEFENVCVDTSWQPAETIGEAVRRIGSERVLFGTDWPLVGQNIRVGLRRIDDCVKAGWIAAADAEAILRTNAARLLGDEQG